MDVQWIRSNGTLLAILAATIVAVGVLTVLVLNQQQHDETAGYGQVSLVTGPPAGAPPKASTPVPANVPAPPAPQVVPAPQVAPAPKVAPAPRKSLPQVRPPQVRPQPRALPIPSPPQLAPQHAVTPVPEAAPADSATHLSAKGGPPEVDHPAADSGATGSGATGGTTGGTSETTPTVKANRQASTSRATTLTPRAHHDVDVAPSNGDSNSDQLDQPGSTIHKSPGTSRQRSAIEREFHSRAQGELPPGPAPDSTPTG
jgi:outer membrane biosynthesis protein TonB